MKICTEHAERMKKALAERGLDRFIAKTSEESMERTISELEHAQDGEEGPISNWDPLMQMNWNFMARAIEIGGLYLLQDNEDGSNDGHYCPLCEAREAAKAQEAKELFDEGWIVTCADTMLEFALNKGLITRQ